jgi:hypothetical protein
MTVVLLRNALEEGARTRDPDATQDLPADSRPQLNVGSNPTISEAAGGQLGSAFRLSYKSVHRARQLLPE